MTFRWRMLERARQQRSARRLRRRKQVCVMPHPFSHGPLHTTASNSKPQAGLPGQRCRGRCAVDVGCSNCVVFCCIIVVVLLLLQ